MEIWLLNQPEFHGFDVWKKQIPSQDAFWDSYRAPINSRKYMGFSVFCFAPK